MRTTAATGDRAPLVALALALAVPLVAGCLSGPTGPEATDDLPDLGHEGVTLVGPERTVADGEDWGRLRLQATGEPGSYLVAYQPWPEGADDDLHVRYRLDALVGEDDTADDLGLLFVPPHATASGADGLVPLPDEFGRASGAAGCEYANSRPLVVYEGIGGASFDCRFEPEAPHGGSAGVFLAVGSNGAWSLNATLVRDPTGPTVRPSHVAAGNASFVTQADALAGSPADAVDRKELTAEVETAGWSHVGVRTGAEADVEADVRRYRVAFPSGFTYQADGSLVEVEAEDEEVEREDNVPDHVGTWTDEAGSVDAVVDYVEDDGRLDLGFAHLDSPWSKLGVTVPDEGYVGSSASGEACRASLTTVCR